MMLREEFLHTAKGITARVESSRCSTEAKKESISRWATILFFMSSCYEEDMIILTTLYACILIVTGLLSYYVWSNGESWTALIPFIGGCLVLFQVIWAARKPDKYKIFIHVALTLALLMFLGTVPAFFKVPTLLENPELLARPVAVKVQLWVALLSLAYLGAGIRSFINARVLQGKDKGLDL